MSLSEQSIMETIQQLQKYRDELKFKSAVFVQRLAEVGIKVIDANKYAEEGDSWHEANTYVWLQHYDDHEKAILVYAGRDVAFVEFGAGITYNGAAGSSPNKFGSDLGFTIGSYGKGHGKDESWMYYDEDRGRWIKSYGTKAARPMEQANDAMKAIFFETAIKVFE